MLKRHRRPVALILILVFLVTTVPFLPPIREAVAAVPVIKTITPNTGGIGGGYLIDITGNNFQQQAVVKISGKTAKVVDYLPDAGDNDGRLTVEVPAGNEVGKKDVLVLNPDNTWDLATAGFEYLEGPVITTITPNFGMAGQEIEITGTNFSLGTGIKVRIGGIEVPLKELEPGVFRKDTLLKVAAPSGLTGTVSVEAVIMDGGQETQKKVRVAEGFTYSTALSSPQITDLLGPLGEPKNTGLTLGGEPMTIIGSDFRVGVSPQGPVLPKVYFGSFQATVLRVTTNTIELLTPGNTAGRKDVLVQNPDGRQSNKVDFTYHMPEREIIIDSITPNEGSLEGGTMVTVVLTNPPNFGSPPGYGNIDWSRTSLTIGGIPAGELKVYDENPDDDIPPRALRALTPGGSLGQQDVILTLYIYRDPENPDLAEVDVFEVVKRNGFTYKVPESRPKVFAVNRLLVPLVEWRPDDPDQLGNPEGPLGEKTPIIITGQDFRSPGPGQEFRVLIGLEYATDVVVLDSQHVYARVPVALTPGVRDVTVENPDGATARLRKAYTYRGSALRVDSITPAFGPVSGGTRVVIRGANFSTDVGGLEVSFGYVDAQGNVFWENALFDGPRRVEPDGDGERITVRTPPNTVGWKNVRVRNAYGEYILPNGFYYHPPAFNAPIIFTVTPAEGPVTGGTAVTIKGTNFATGAMVRIGNYLADSARVVVRDVETIELITPPGDPGQHGVTVTNPDGQSYTWWDPNPVSPRYFFYYSAPRITGVEPSRGAYQGGGIITLTGEQFYPGAQVFFGDVYLGKDDEGNDVWGEIPAPQVFFVDNKTLRVRLPALLEPRANVNIRIRNADGGTFTLPGGFSFITVDVLPLVQAVVPDFGPTTGNVEVVITGQNFAPNPTVWVGWVRAANVKAISKTEIRAVFPANPPGIHDVTVINRDGGAGVLAGAFTYYEALTKPVIKNIYPSRGPKEGGTYITITGDDFWEGARVFFGAVEVTNEDIMPGERPSLEVVDPQTIRVFTPAHPVGKVDVRVLNPDGGTAFKKDGFEYLSPHPDYLPEITGVEPAEGTTAGGTLVTLTGKNLWRNIEVFLGGLPISKVTRIDNNTLQFVTPPRVAGPVEITVANQDGGTFTLFDAFHYRLPGSSPAIESITPAVGRAGEVTEVEITGQDFRPGIRVLFGSMEGTVVGDVAYDRIMVRTPPGPKGKVDVTVWNLDLGIATKKNGFEFKSSVPKITSINPDQGRAEGGDMVIIRGTDFRNAPGFTVYFGRAAVAPENITWIDSTPENSVIRVKTPAKHTQDPLGPVDVRVVNPDLEEAVKKAAFIYKLPASAPEITSVQPNTGPSSGGIWVLLKGTDFRVEAKVYFQGTPSKEVRVVDGQTVWAKLPAYHPGVVDITIVNYDGGSYTLMEAFTYVEPGSNPRLDRLDPNRGPHLGGTTVTITGLDFRTGVKVFIDGVEAASTTFVDYRTIRIVTPPGTPGSKDVLVVNPDQGVVTAPRAFSYYQVSEPAITSVIPGEGATSGGTAITITGTNFRSGATVTIGGLPATGVVVDNATTIRAITPPGSLGWKAVTVTNPDGGFVTLPNGFRYVRPRSVPDVPTGLRAVTFDATTIKLTWSPAEFTGFYEVYLSTTESGPYRLLDQTRDTTYFATGLQANTRYFFKVRGVNELGTSSLSNEAWAWTLSSAAQPQPVAPVAGKLSIKAEKGRVEAVIPTLEALQELSYRLDLGGQAYRSATQFVVLINGAAAKGADRNTVIITTLGTVNMPRQVLNLTRFNNMTATQLEDSWLRLTIADAGGQAAEKAQRLLPKNTLLLSAVVWVEWETQVGKEIIPNASFAANVTWSMPIQSGLNISGLERSSIYQYQPAARQWQSLPGQVDFLRSTVSAGIAAPGQYLLAIPAL